MVAGRGGAGHGGGTGATPLEERVLRLEKDVEELREQVRAQAQGRASAGPQNWVREETSGEAATATAERPAQREVVSSPFAEATRNRARRRGGNAGEGGPLFGLFPDGLPPATWWVARAGVVLLLVGVSFLVRMGVEQGWLTPAVRVTGGVVIGVALSAFGLRARTSRPAYSQLLVGGGVVAFYLSAFGAWSVWHLVPYEAAFAFCVLTTAFAFAAAVRLSAEWLALLGVVGGYATPFMLFSPYSNVPALVAYSLLLLGGYLMVYVFRGWRSVYGSAILGIWTILAVSDLGARTYTTSIEGVLPTDAAWSVSTGALVAWLTMLFLTSARRYLLAGASATVSVASANGGGRTGVLTEAAATSVAPLVALLLGWSAWPSGTVSGVDLASLAVAMALVHFIAYAVVANRALSSSVAGASRGQQGNGGLFEASALTGLLEGGPAESTIALALRYARTQAFAAVVLLTLAVVFLLDGAALASALAVEGALLVYLVRPSVGGETVPRLSGRRLITAKSWLLLMFAALYSLGTVVWRAIDPFGVTGGEDAYLPFLNGDALSLLAVVASLFFVGRLGVGADASPWRGVAAGFRLLGHLILALGVVSEFARSDLSSGVSFAFLALYALALALARFFSERNLPTTDGPRAHSPAPWRPPSWVASWLDVGAVLCVVAPWLWERLDIAGTWTGYTTAASQALSESGANLANLVGVLVLFGVAGLLFLWGNASRGSSTAWEDESLLPAAAVLLLAASTFFALCWTWTVLDPLSGGGALVSVAWGVLSAALLAGPALLLAPSPRETGSAGLVYWASRAGYAVLALVVAKLFLYDLAAVEPILRILLFCGFGTAFLLAAYLFGGERGRSRSDT
ncbi:MAG: DUF2339 domain-containing protein [Actinomycetota bacterium]|nr:DUF2339 domain-containing protein [Actinomycetota bacterium]